MSAMVILRAGTSWRRMSVYSRRGDDHVDDLDADEGGDDPADAVDDQVAAQHRRRPEGPELDALQGERDEGHDDEGVEDHRRQDGRVRVCQVHDVEGPQRPEDVLEHGGDYGE